MNNKNKRTNQKGFTLIELMIVVAIIGALSAIAVPAYQNYVAKSEAASGLATLKSIMTTAELFYQENGIASAATEAALGTATDANDLGTIASTLSGALPTLSFEFGANSSMTSSDTITFTRDSDTGWSCARSGNVPAIDGCQ
ncbi:prepilin-type N-terminal cleavage/methylation domain-containing protein [Vibrio chagasii]|uniref:pilin n=1 Tax=Vibrio chagasii TaxID=170679 RepID=UPI003DA95B32